MIYLHPGSDAEARIGRVVSAVSGAVLECAHAPGRQLNPDEISVWLSKTEDAKLIVVKGGSAANRAERRLFESLRRIAKFKGIDVHIAGDRSIEMIADLIVKSDEDLTLDAPGSSVGEQVAALIKSETLTKFQPAEMDIPTVREAMAASGCSEAEALQRIKWMKSQKVFVNNLYQVNIEPLPDDMAHLIIRRLDKQPIHNWPHFQEIKNQLLGPDCEAVEIYPPEKKLVDAKHHYHLWGFRKAGRTLGLGFTERQVADPD